MKQSVPVGVTNKEAGRFIGKTIVAVKKDGSTVAGKVVGVRGNELLVSPLTAKGKKVHTNALLPLVLFDVLAIEETQPFFGGFFPGFGGFGGFGGFPGFWW